MAAPLVSGIEAVVFDLFGTLVYEFPRADWDGWLETSAAILEADVDAFKAAWQATGIERQTGRLGDVEENLRTVAARAGAWPTDAQLTEVLDARAEMYRKWFVPRPGAEEVLARLRARRLPARSDQHVRARRAGDVARVAAREAPSTSRCSRATSGSASPTPRSTCSRPSVSASRRGPVCTWATAPTASSRARRPWGCGRC